jgi:hypothetical protein
VNWTWRREQKSPTYRLIRGGAYVVHDLLRRIRDVVIEELLDGVTLMDAGGGDLGREGQFRDQGWKYEIFVVDAWAGCSRWIMESLLIRSIRNGKSMAL